MPKVRTRSIFICQQCAAESTKWLGRCPDCNSWNSFVETEIERANGAGATAAASYQRSEPKSLSSVTSDEFRRLEVPFTEFNRVLGGGIVPGSLVLIGGDPGIGKSTLLVQVSTAFANHHGQVLYVSGEESLQQIKMRADRIGLQSDNLLLLAETSLENIFENLMMLRPAALVIDSIQTIFSEGLQAAAGSISQVRECTVRLQRWAKANHVPTFLVGHVTKDGAIAGPKALEHIVDCVLYLEGERFQSYRLLRSTKNRFGSTHEVGVFEMLGEGMVEVLNPSAAFLSERDDGTNGSTVTVTMEGTRPILVEIQGLTSATGFGQPRRMANGIDLNRLHLLTAVLTKRVGLAMGQQDIFVNVVGGFKIGEPAADLAIALAIASSFRDHRLNPEMVVLGEIGLGGEIRAVGQLERRLIEAQKLGFSSALVPGSTRLDRLNVPGMQLHKARDLDTAIQDFA